MNHVSGRRLAAALLTLTTATAVTGTLLAAPAVAAPAAAAAEGRCLPSAPGLLPVGAEIVSTGAYGYLTSCTDENGEKKLERHEPNGTVSVLGAAQAYDSSSDWMVTENSGYITAYNPVTGSYSNHVLRGGVVAGVAHNVVYESRPTASGSGRELWQLTNNNGVTHETKLSNLFSGETETAHKVVAAGRDAGDRPVVLVLGQGLHYVNGRQEPHSWSAVLPVPTGSVVPYGYGPGWNWDESTVTGGLNAAHQAWITHRADGGRQITVRGTVTKTIPITNVSGDAVLAGIIGDMALYAAKRDPQAGPEVMTPLYAVDVTAAVPTPVKVMESFSSAARHPDGSLLVRGTSSAADGLFRIDRGADGKPSLSLVADTGRAVGMRVTASVVPSTVNLEKATAVAMEWTLTRPDAGVEVTLTHTATGRKRVARVVSPVSGTTFRYLWDGLVDGVSAPNGAYTWSVTASPSDGTAPATASGRFTVTRLANGHDFTDNGSTDVLARDAAGVLWRDDLFDWPVGGQVKPAKRTKIGTGWNTYKHIEAAGNIGGAAHGDLVALDGSGVLWHYLGKGDGTFTARYKIGGGWGIYNKLAAGSDLGADGKADLFATDTSGVLWFYRGTGSPTTPYAPRIRMGAGWGIYNQLAAVGDIAGDAGGDLVARDKDGVLWLYTSNGYTFAPRVRIGAGWGAFTQLVGAGDLTNDGRPDLIAYGPGGTSVYRSTGSATAPFSRQSTSLYAGEGSRFTSLS